MRKHVSRTLCAREKHSVKCICTSNFKNIFQNRGHEFNFDCMFDSLDAYDEDRMYKEMYSLIMAVRKHEGLSVPEGY